MSSLPLLTHAFPGKMISEVLRVGLLLSPHTIPDHTQTFTVSCEREPLRIPYRIYQSPLPERKFTSLPPLEQSIIACWFSRHHGGRVREQFLRALPAYDTAWKIGYVIALCGEYVREILDVIWDRRELFDLAILAVWIRENPEFYSRTRSRIVSYWDCYYRSSFPKFESYVGSQLLDFFEGARA